MRNKIKVLNSLYWIFLIGLIYYLINQFLTQYELLSWNLSEFLINYEAGFIRRGFLGEILFYFIKYTGFQIEWVIKIFSLIGFVFLSFFFVKKFLNKGYSLYILPLSFFLGGPILAGFWLRKDCWMICFLIIIIRLFVLLKEKNALLNVLIVNLLTICALLTHEVFVFFSLPILFVLFISSYKRMKKNNLAAIYWSFISLLPILIVFLLVVVFHGDSSISQNIWNSWCILLNQDISNVGTNNAIGAISWSIPYTFKCHFAVNFLVTNNGIFSSVYWFIVIFTVYYISTNVLYTFKKSAKSFILRDQTALSVIIIFQFICLIPVFVVLSCDYIRLFFYWISSSFVIFLLLPSSVLDTLFPGYFYKIASKANSQINSFVYPTKGVIVLLMLFIGISATSLYIKIGYRSSMIYTILYMISKPLTLLRSLFI